ncbi:hypothetical protein [Goodfellowiella coeruleoviolacea]|uniref:hypothetical protein n=1 Tax=Goodfellowiella coeruleoviolacea TaxID=334858 RepID=UPI000AD0C374|nr:hypothetical protein [Goodfellowiella coeruleoviolacea]
MYIDESGGADTDIKVTVDGEEYTAQENYDLDDDGVNESAVVETDDGGHLAFSDTDGDGDADLMTEFDENGDLVSQARFDAESGEWVTVDASSDPTAQDADAQGTTGGAGQGMTVDTGDGPQQVGPATEDSDGDGVADTAVVRDDDGDVWLFTDVDGDGQADSAIEMTRDGQVTTSQHTGDGDWTVVEQGHIDEQGKYVTDSTGGRSSDEIGWDDETTSAGQSSSGGATFGGVVRIDSATGQWISPN